MTGAYNLKPNKPKYNVTREPEIVLDLFNKNESNEMLSFKELTLKLITLLAIVTAQ